MSISSHIAAGVGLVGTKGGVGTTSVAVLCAAATAAEGRGTLLVDLSGDAAGMVGVEPDTAGVSDIVRGDASLADCTVVCGGGLELLPAGSDPDRSRSDAGALAGLWSDLAQRDGFVVIDAGAGPGAADLIADAAVDLVAVTDSSFASLTRWRLLADRTDRLVLCADGRLGVGEHNARDFLGRAPDVVLGDDALIATMADAGHLARHGREQPRRFAAVAGPGMGWEPPGIA